MFRGITFESILPSLVVLTAALAGIWFAFWALSRAIDAVATRLTDERRAGIVQQMAAQLTRLLRGATGAATLLVAVLIMLHGVGISEVPRFTWAKLAAWVNDPALPILFITGSAFVLLRSLYLVADRLPGLVRRDGSPAQAIERRKRAQAAGRLLRWGGTAAIVTVGGLMLLQQIGVDLTPILTGGAIASVAVGFGAQNLVRDVISGLFLIGENQVRVGDVANINGKGGLVEAIRLRTIVLRGLDGTVHVFPNGAINELSNLTKDFSYYVIDVGVAYRDNVDCVMSVLRGVGDELAADPAFARSVLEPLEILGVDAFADSAVVIKIRIKTLPIEQWNVGRELRRRIKNRFDEVGIEIPFPHLSLYAGRESGRFDVAVAALASDLDRRGRDGRSSSPAPVPAAG
jgi:small-conductance mechanosensitive channel